MTRLPRSGRKRPEVDVSPPSRLERWLLRRMIEALGRPPMTFVLWNGEALDGGAAEAPRFRVYLRDRHLVREILRSPDLGLGEAYMDGRLEMEGDLVAAIEGAFQASHRSARWARRLSRALTWRPRFNSRRRARRNVERHYDLGNDFYKLWLDERLLYTCAYFERPGMGLEEAQLAKMDHVCRKLRLRPGERVVEAGCGWGALALHMAEHYGASVRAFNVSKEQIAYAREEAKRRGLAGRVQFIEDDYRNVSGTCDVFVSVGMLEHVGPRHYRRLGRVIDGCLAPEGRGLLHFIGHTDPIPMNAWLNRYIFPGAYIPALSEALTVLESRLLEVQDVENLRRHYGRTLEHWLERFEKSAEQVERMYDERFVRMWRLYLSSCIASFRSGSSVLYQVLFSRYGQKTQDWLPWTRRDLYEQL
jgi:cyclopropane-fatty-acyl-phospholipid synthase